MKYFFNGNEVDRKSVYHYKARAECFHDVCVAMEIVSQNAPIDNVEFHGIGGFPDQLVSFDSKLDYKELAEAISKDLLSASDLHVFIESLKPEEFFDGERDGLLSI